VLPQHQHWTSFDIQNDNSLKNCYCVDDNDEQSFVLFFLFYKSWTGVLHVDHIGNGSVVLVVDTLMYSTTSTDSHNYRDTYAPIDE
jgi:hypothetical protein